MTTETLTTQQKAAKVRAASNGGVHPGGRTPIYDRKAVCAYVCQQIARGRSLRRICEDEGMPSLELVMDWRATDPEFLQQYVRAREDQADYYADEITEIADTETDANKARVRIDARKWVASKLKSKSYGEKITNEHVGKDGDAIQVNDASADARRVAFMLGRAMGKLDERKKAESDSTK